MKRNLQYQGYSLTKLDEYSRGNVPMLREFLHSWLTSVRRCNKILTTQQSFDSEVLKPVFRQLIALMEMIDAEDLVLRLKLMQATANDENYLENKKLIKDEVHRIMAGVKGYCEYN